MFRVLGMYNFGSNPYYWGVKTQVSKFLFKTDIENPKLEKLNFWSTLIGPLPDLWIFLNYNCLFLVGKSATTPFRSEITLEVEFCLLFYLSFCSSINLSSLIELAYMLF